MQIAYLHDLVEDTETTLSEIEGEFGTFVSQCVALLTDEEGDNRKPRKAASHKKLRLVNAEFHLALVVKAGDRLANLWACVSHSNKRLLTMYQREHAAFKAAVYRPRLCEAIWNEIERLIES